MLLRLIIAISLLFFSLLLMAGLPVEQALYRSMLAFLLLFAGLYTSIFLINVIREISHRHDTTAPEGDVKDQKSSRVKEQKKR
jgi:hypothetical protein